VSGAFSQVVSRDEISLSGAVWSPERYYPVGTLSLRLFELPNWTTATRPTTNLNPGRTGFNTDLGVQEQWNGTSWVSYLAGSATLTWPAAASAVVANGTYEIALSWPWQFGSIVSVVAKSTTGSFTAALEINGSAISGLGAIAVSSTQSTTAAGTNSIANGGNLTLVVSGASGSPTDATVQINYLRSAN